MLVSQARPLTADRKRLNRYSMRICERMRRVVRTASGSDRVSPSRPDRLKIKISLKTRCRIRGLRRAARSLPLPIPTYARRNFEITKMMSSVNVVAADIRQNWQNAPITKAWR